MLLVIKQPDLGTSLTYIPILICGVLMAGLRTKYLLIIATALLVLFQSVIIFLSHTRKIDWSAL